MIHGGRLGISHSIFSRATGSLLCRPRATHALLRADEEGLAALIKNFVKDELASDDPKFSDVLDALTGGMRVALLRDTIKRLLRVTKVREPIVTEVNSIFEQLGEIHFFRDRMAHHGSSEAPKSVGEGWFSIWNFITVKNTKIPR